MKKNAKLMLALCLLAVVLTSGVFSTFGATPPESSSANLSPSGQHTPSPSDVSASSFIPEAVPLDESAPLDEDAPPAEGLPSTDGGNSIVPLMAQNGSQIEPVITIANPTEDPSPVLIFNSPFEGSVRFFGAWNSSVTTVVQGENMVEFEPMADGYYENCSIEITGQSGQTVTWVHPGFTVQARGISNLWNHMKTAGFDYDTKVLNNPIEAAWLANHHDMIVTGNVRTENIYDSLRNANPNVFLIGYISMQVEPEKWLEKWAADNGYDPEDLYYHYYYDTEVQLTKGRKIIVPGWGGGSATSRKEARAVIMYGGYTPMCPTSPLFVKAYSAMAMEQLTVNAAKGKYIDGLFIDGYSEILTGQYSLQNTIEFRNKYGVVSAAEANILAGKDMTNMRNAMEMYASALLARDIHMMGNAAEADWPNGHLKEQIADHFDNTYNEITIEFLTKPIRTRQHDIQALKGLYDNMEAGVMVMANSETSWPTRFRDPANPDDDWSEEKWDNYNQHVIATQYLIAHKNGYFAYHAGSASIYNAPDGTFSTSHWHVNYEFDIGKPVKRAETDYWGENGTDRFYTFELGPYTLGQGTAYRILAREYDYALVIAKFGGDSYPSIGRDPVTHNLGGSYRRLLADNTLGPIITQITLGQGEGAILIKLDENGNPLCDATIAPGPGNGGNAAPPSSSSKVYSGKPSSSSSTSSSTTGVVAEITSSSSQPAPSAYSSIEIVNPAPTTPLTEAPEKIKVWMLVLAITGIVLVVFLLVLLISRLAAKRRQN